MPPDLLAAYAAGEKGAREAARAGAAVVMVDAYRASTTICILVDKGARVVPVASVEEARRADADFRIGERGSARVEGFDANNSPTQVRDADIPPGSTVVLTSTNGTRILAAARGAPEVLTGAFVNASAVADALCSSTVSGHVVTVGCGWRGRRASEDESAAACILTRLRERGARLDAGAERVVEASLRRTGASLRTNSAARRLLRLGYGEDLDLCLAHDTVPVVPRLVDGAFVNGDTRSASTSG